jgi:putative copper export protein
MNYGITVLVVIHVLGAAFWFGAVLFLVGFVAPAVASAPAEGGPFMQRLVATSRFPVALGIAGGTTILSGLALFWIVSGGFSRAFVSSPPGMLLSTGAAAGILAVGTGVLAGRIRANGRSFAIATAVLLCTAIGLMTAATHL